MGRKAAVKPDESKKEGAEANKPATETTETAADPVEEEEEIDTEDDKDDEEEVAFMKRYIRGEIKFALPPSIEYARKRLKRLLGK